MRKTIFAALAATSALIATPAAAQNATGTINITGNVEAKCQITDTSGAVAGFNSTVALGELAKQNGTLRDSSALSTLFNQGGTGTAAMSFRVICTSATPNVSVTALPIMGPTGTQPTGYSNRVDYDATATFALVSGGPTAVEDDSELSGATSATLGARLAAADNNVTVTADNFRTDADTDILVAGAYTGTVTILIKPAA